MKTFLLFFMILWSVSFVSSQNQVQYEILQNDPQTTHNLLFYISPLTLTASNNVSVLFGLGSSYNHKDQFMVEFDFRRSYTEGLNEYINDFDGIRRSQRYAEPMTANKHLMLMELKGQYLLGSHLGTGKVKVEIYSTSQSSTYIKVPAQRFVAFPARLGYTYYQTIMTSNRFGSSGTSPFIGTAVNNPNATPEAISGMANFGAHLLHFGLGVYIRDNITIAITDHRPDYQGIKNKIGSVLWYVDVLVPMAQNLENVRLTEKTYSTTGDQEITETEYNLNDHTPKTSYGVRTGLKQIFMGSGLLSGAYWMEAGFRPGPIDNRTNYFFIFGMDIALSKKTN